MRIRWFGQSAFLLVRLMRLILEWRLCDQRRPMAGRALDADRAPDRLRAILQAE